MARHKPEVIQALRNTANTIEKSNEYQWGHMGACNCGFLAQEITSLTKSEIHSRAMEGHGDWSEQLNDYCPSSGFRMDNLISQLIDFGFDTVDLTHLEKLSDPNVLRCLPLKARDLKYNSKPDVLLYLRTMADRLEGKLIEEIELPELVQRQDPLLTH
ncbi:MAG: hypothetical protein RLN86_10960 [Cyclobacteriaceae bacterium]